MGAIKNYPIDFPKRTLELIDSFNKREINYRLDVTLLMNCLLGLIVVAVETSKREKLMPGAVDNGLLKLLPDKIKVKRGKRSLAEVDKEYLSTVDKMTLLKSIRNGIAHQNILARNEHGIWAGIQLWNQNRNNEKTFEIELTTSQLTKLASYIANHYLIKKQKKNGKA